MRKLLTITAISFILLSFIIIHQDTNNPRFAISADKMNVLYSGVENPLSIVVSGHSAENIMLVSQDSSLKISRKGDKFYVRPENRGTVTLDILADNDKKIGSATYRIKSVPNPHALVAGISETGTMTRKQLAHTSRIDTYFPADYDMEFTVQSFEVVIWNKYSGSSEKIEITGRSFTEELKNKFSQMQDGDKVYFQAIRTISDCGIKKGASAIEITVEK